MDHLPCVKPNAGHREVSNEKQPMPSSSSQSQGRIKGVKTQPQEHREEAIPCGYNREALLEGVSVQGFDVRGREIR